MIEIFNLFFESIHWSADWVWRSIVFDVPWYNNYFWGLVLISLIAWSLELIFPWRKEQAMFRKDFWLDAGYMFFNFFAFSILISGFYRIIEFGLDRVGVGMQSIVLLPIDTLPLWVQLLIFFVLLDFVQWFTHVLLHKFDVLWQFHKVHHSVEEMGFAAHLRYHWMENVLYKPLKTLVVMLLGGFEPNHAYMVHFTAIAIGHLNHANVKITWGPLKYIINNPVMHLWHHAKSLPTDRSKGVNFGISLSIWDYIFKTNYIPKEDPDIPLGFEHMDEFPHGFISQNLFGFARKDSSKADNPS